MTPACRPCLLHPRHPQKRVPKSSLPAALRFCSEVVETLELLAEHLGMEQPPADTPAPCYPAEHPLHAIGWALMEGCACQVWGIPWQKSLLLMIVYCGCCTGRLRLPGGGHDILPWGVCCVTEPCREWRWCV